MAANGDYIFFAIAGLIQMGVGAIFLTRPADRKWARSAGLLFLLNGVLSVGNMVLATQPSDDAFRLAAKNLGYLLDPVTSYIILYLALAYPTAVVHRKWLAITIALAAMAQLATGVFQDGLLERLYSSQNLGGFQAAMYVSFVQEVAWTVLLVRWSHAMVRKDVDWRFGLLACAIGVRAAHIPIVSLGVRISKLIQGYGDFWDLAGPFKWQLIISMVPVLALCYALFILLAPRPEGARTHATDIFTGFLLFGIVEALFSMATLVGVEAFQTPFLYVDALVLRPLLVWGSLYGIPQSMAGKIVGVAAFVLLCSSAFIPTGIRMLQQMQIGQNTSVVFGVIFAGVVVVLGIRFLFPLLKEDAWHPPNLKPVDE